MKLWIGLAISVAAASASAQEHRAGRTPDGRPDLGGLWTTATLTSFDRPEELKSLVLTDAEAAAYEAKHRGKPPPIPDDEIGAKDSEWWETDVGLARIRRAARSSWIVSPADGQTPFTAAAKAANKAARDRSKTDFDNPETRPDGERCLATGGPPLEAGAYNNGFRLVQTPDAVVIQTEWMNDARIVRLNGARHAPAAIRNRSGDSIGWWEGETLVIETTNFSPAVIRAPEGAPATDMRVIERLTRISPTELHYGFLVSNPARYTQPVQGEMVFRTTSQPIFEFACHEGNYALTNVLAGGRARDQEARQAAAAGSGGPAR
jgi:hypothetical protein